jgi:hypothetical protein
MKSFGKSAKKMKVNWLKKGNTKHHLINALKNTHPVIQQSFETLSFDQFKINID